MKAQKKSAKGAGKPASSTRPAAPKKSAASSSSKSKAAVKPAAKAAPASKAHPAPPTPVPGKSKVQDQSTSKAKTPVKASAAKAAAPAKTSTPARAARALAPGSLPTEDELRAMSDDEYMNEVQLEFFRTRLAQMRQEVLQREMDVKERLHEREMFADPADRATAEEEHWLDLRLRERESLLLKKIDDALRRIEAKEYGYCEKTGDPIGIPRLLARPTATVCVDIKGQDERVEAQFRDR
ncbi:transcriptional regulator, TraR/DksA family [Solimonas aquatica]|uniref:Transcriptional regulator, TraR/DksA family n=1 Tax=Solimonas aquatica TaxID=489703 RepID=A0A1H9IIS9_9GAMM|nr:transcriptional regulator, TraR/DksA family [Solimonas aquatica]